ncbi:MAG: hypothetical protein ABIT58_08725 [Ferruginibacter sp.]
MKKQIILCMFIFTSFYLSSCYRIAFSKVGAFQKSASPIKISNAKKDVVFIPMHHVGKKEFYDDVKRIADSLQNLGYVFYYEAVKISPVKDSLSADTLRRKMRKVIGNDVFSAKVNGGYIDTVNHTFLHKKLKIIRKENLVNQPPFIRMNIDTAKGRWGDAYLSDMIPAFEKKFGNIALSDCDFSTALDAKYKCSKHKGKEEKNFLLVEYRNECVATKMMNNPDDKIAVIYGAMHFDGVLKMLQQYDSTWKKTDP